MTLYTSKTGEVYASWLDYLKQRPTATPCKTCGDLCNGDYCSEGCYLDDTED